MAWTLSRATGRRTSWTWTVSPGTRASRMPPFSWRATFTTRRSAPSKEGPHRAGAEGIRETFTDEESGHYAHQSKHHLQRTHQQLATPSTIMAGSPSTATELLYSSRDVDGGCRDIDGQSLRIRDRSVICTHAGWDHERRTDITDTAENLLSKLIFPLC